MNRPERDLSDSGCEWIGAIPSHWKLRRLKYVTNLINGAAFKPDEWEDEGTPIIRIENLNGSAEFNKTQRIMPSKYHVVQDDLLFGWSGNRGTSFGPFWWSRSGHYYLNQHIFKVTDFDVHKRWLYWALKAVTFEVESRVHGIIGLVHVTRPELDNTLLPVPPREEQPRIAGFLDRKTAAIDELIAKKERLVALLQEQRQTLILQAVTSSFTGLGDGGKEISWAQNSLVRGGWATGRLCYHARIGNGSTPSREEPSYWSRNAEGVPWLNSSKINDERIEHADDWVSETALRECHLPKIGAGSVLVALTGEGQTRGRAALLLMDATISQHLAYVVPDRSRLQAEFLWYQFQAMYGWLRGESSGGGSTRAALTCQFLRSVPVVVPPLEEQDEVIVELRKRLNNLDSLKLSLSASIGRLREYRQALITAAVTGQIDVTQESAPSLSASPSPASIRE